ncbi:MAG: hypothetical protein ACO3GO_06275 [Terrimicrobiaceae bacterium]
MTLGRSSTGAIKIKTDEAGGGLRAVECGCCGGPGGYYYEFFDEACPELSYWYAAVTLTIFEDGSKYYEAQYSSARGFGLWSKTGAVDDPIDFTGTYADEYGYQDAVMTLKPNSSECDGGTRINFNITGFYADCDFNSISFNVYACGA